MFVWTKTHNKLINKYNSLIKEEIKTNAELRNTQTLRDNAEKLARKAQADIERLKNNIQGYNDKTVKLEATVKSLKAELVEQTDKAESMFASAGGYSGQLSTLRNKVMALTKIADLKDLQKRLAASEKRKKNAAAKKANG